MKTERGIKKFLWFFVKLAIAVAIIAILVSRNPKEIIKGFETFDYWYLAPALFCYGLHMVVSAWRWWRLTRVLNVKMGGFEALSLTMQGYFFSLVIPGGAIGGDVIKMGFVTKRSPAGHKAEGAFTILMDRIVGMIALFGLALVLTLLSIKLLLKVEIPDMNLNDAMRWGFILGMIGVCLAGLGISCVVFMHGWIEKIPPFGALMRWVDKLSRGMLTRLTTATDIYARAWRELTMLTVVSTLFIHLMVAAAFVFLVMGLHLPGSEHIGVWTIITAITLANMVGLIPLSPGGIGLRDITAITILAAGGIASGEAKTAQLLYTAMIICYNLTGGIFFLCDPGRRETETILLHEEVK